MENHATTLTKITPQCDPWEAYMDIQQHGKLTLSSIEFTTTYLCNMRCERCAVGYMLEHKDPDALPIELLFDIGFLTEPKKISPYEELIFAFPIDEYN